MEFAEGGAVFRPRIARTRARKITRSTIPGNVGEPGRKLTIQGVFGKALSGPCLPRMRIQDQK